RHANALCSGVLEATDTLSPGEAQIETGRPLKAFVGHHRVVDPRYPIDTQLPSDPCQEVPGPSLAHQAIWLHRPLDNLVQRTPVAKAKAAVRPECILN